MSRVGEGEGSRREQGKDARRDAILEAAKSLIREFGPQRAGVSTATVYNLIGPREQLLGLLLSDLFEHLRATVTAMKLVDPFRVGEAVVSVSANMFVSDSSLWLNVISEVRGAIGARVLPFVTFQPINLQREAMLTAKQLSMLSREADPEMTATQIYAAYNGALFLWAGGFLSDDAFRNQAKAGYWAVLAALGAGEYRRRALRELNDLHGARTRALLAEIDLDGSRL
jgi:AcrR family transcriptional regulator